MSKLPQLATPMPNLTKVTLNDQILWFSYTTLVAFVTAKAGVVVSKNRWTIATGRHLNLIDDGQHQYRLDQAAFDRLVEVHLS